MSGKKGLFDRRSVLRATAGTATGMAALVSAAGSASASSFKPGDCVITSESAGAYTQCNGVQSYPVDAGVTGKVKSECKEDPSEYYVDWDDSSYTDGWIYESKLDHC